MAQAEATETRTYSLTPEQFNQFMADMPDLASFVRLDARIGPEGAYSTGTISRGSTQAERERLGLSGRPEDSVGSLRRFFDRTGAATGYTIRSDDPAIQAKLREMGIAGVTDQERERPMMERMREIIDGLRRAARSGSTARAYREQARRFEMPMDSSSVAELFSRLAAGAQQAPTYTLTPEQFGLLMRRRDMHGLVAMDDLMVHIGPNGNFSRVYIQPEGPLGVGAVATAESRFNRFTGRPESFVLSTSDPRILNALRDMGIQPRTVETRAETARPIDRAYERAARRPGREQ